MKNYNPIVKDVEYPMARNFYEKYFKEDLSIIDIGCGTGYDII